MIYFVVGLLATYILITLWLAGRARSINSGTVDDYFLHSRNVGWFHLAMTMFATWMSTFAFIGSPEKYFKDGVGWLLPHGLLIVASPLLAYFLGRRIWKLGKAKGYLTPGDLLGDIYSSKGVKVLVGVLSVLALVPYSLIQLIAIGKVVEFGTAAFVSYEAAVWAAAVTICAYCLFGGIRAIVWTDIIQGVLFMIVMLVGAYLAVSLAGGFETGANTAVANRPELFQLDASKWGAYLTNGFIWTVGYILLPHMWQRNYMASSISSLKKSALLGSVVGLIVIVIPSVLIGFYGASVVQGDVETNTFVVSLYSLSSYSEILIPILILATFAAGMSTIDSQILSASSVVVKDIFQPLFGRSRELNVKVLSQIFIVLFVTLIAFIATGGVETQAIVTVGSKGTAIAALFFVPLLVALFSSRVGRAEGVLYLAVGAVSLYLGESGLLPIDMPYHFGPIALSVVLQTMGLILYRVLRR